MADSLDVIRAPALAGVPHGFFGRAGGVSTGEVAGLQIGLGAGDDPASVTENRQRALQAIAPGAALVMPYQVHSPHAVVVTGPWTEETRPAADAVVTDRPGLVLGVVTADCAPILLADRDAGVVAAAHAGWRGAQGGVIEAALEAMERLGAQTSRIRAAIGPCIAQASYEVDAPFRAHFSHEEERFFVQGQADRWQFDLAGYCAARLHAYGVAAAESVGLDTYTATERFYSFRRATHLGQASYGRQASLIAVSGAVA